MNICKTFAIRESSIKKGTFLVIPHPFTSDIKEIIEGFNTLNKDIKEGNLALDISGIIGNRKGRYIYLDIKDYKALRESKRDMSRHIDELDNLKIQYFSTLDESTRRFLMPISLRKKVQLACS